MPQLDIATLSIRVDSAGAIKGVTDLDKLTAAAGKAEGAVENVGTASKGAGVGMANLSRTTTGAGNSMRMAAQQLSQVGQQTMATGNFVQALAIQLPDLGLAFGAAGAAAGLLAGIALPLVVNALTSGVQASKVMQDAQNAMVDAVNGYTTIVEQAAASTSDLAAKYGSLSEVATQALAALAGTEYLGAIGAIRTEIDAVTSATLKANTAREALLSGRATVLAEDFGMAASTAERFRDALTDLSGAKSLDAQADAANRAQQALFAAYKSINDMPPALVGVSSNLSQIVLKSGETRSDLAQMAMKMSGFSDASAIAASKVRGIGSAASDALLSVTALAGKMYEAIGAAGEISSARAAAMDYVDNAKTIGMYQLYGQSRTQGQRAPGSTMNDLMNPKPKGAFGGGGGGAGTDDFAAHLKQLQDDLMTEKQTTDAWYADAQKTLADRRAIEILGEKGHKEALLQVEQDYQQKLAAIAASTSSSRLSDAADLFTSLASIAEIGGKKQAKTAATLAAVATTVAGYQTAMTAAALAPTLWGKAAAYAGWIAQTAKAVSAIHSAAGTGGGGIGGGQIAAQAQQQEAPQQRLIVQGVRPDEWISGQMLFDMFSGEARLRNAPIVQLLR